MPFIGTTVVNRNGYNAKIKEGQSASTLHKHNAIINGSSAIVLGLFYGLRRSEVLGLRWCDINFDKQPIYIHRTVTKMITAYEAYLE